MPRWIADVLSIAGAVALGISIARFDNKLAFPGAFALLPTGGTFLLIASGPGGWFNRHVLSRNVLVWIGLISYPLYLWHWPILSFASIVEMGTPPTTTRVVAVLASFALALATYLLIEKPIRFGPRRSFKAVALVAFSVLVGMVGFATFAGGGLPARFPAEVRAFADFQYEYKTDARYPDCWLSGTQPFDGFAPFCTGSTGNDRAVVWGDSHAARLYPGLKAVLGDKVALSQFTRDACPPMLGVATPVCEQSNAWIFAQIARIKPQTVILFCYWTGYQVDWKMASPAKDAFLKTVVELQKAGVEKVVVVGPAPRWKGALPKLLYKAWTESRPFHVIPERLATDLEPMVFEADRDMRQELSSRNVTYVSLIDMFCTDEGCLTHAPDAPTHLVTWDYGHLTTDGATLVARRIVADGVLP